MTLALTYSPTEDTSMGPGDTVDGRFVIETHIGTGGMGVVFRARDRQAGLVALKVGTEDGSEARFEHEATLLAELDHPTIVSHVAHGHTASGRRYLAMEWLEGEDLASYLARRGALAPAEVLAIARRAADALAFAHARGIVHRDIKPQNLFLPDSDPTRLKVLDFGIARSLFAGPLDHTQRPITRTGSVVGTAGYMSPEQATGEPLDGRSDVFALGCVLFECLTGRPAFVGANVVAVLAKVLLEEVPPARSLVPSVPRELDALVARMLAKSKEGRPRNGAAVLRALEGVDLGCASSSSGQPSGELRLATILLARGLERAIGGEVKLSDGSTLIELSGEDSATRAAALALSLVRDAPLACLAIATGRVAGDGAGAFGPIIDRVASILPSKPGIAIDELSATLLGDRFSVVEGRLSERGTATAQRRLLLGKPTPFVGREKELGLALATVRESASEPVARALVVTGPAGSGKSRLVRELIAAVTGEARVLIARGDPVGAGSALALARQLVVAAALAGDASETAPFARLRAHLGHFFSADALERVAENLGELVGHPSPRPSPALLAARSDPRAHGQAMSRAFRDWLGALCDDGPVLCVLEDLHWGDLGSVRLLDEALEQLAAQPLTVLALARPEVHDLFPDLWVRRSAQELKLGSLTRKACERLIKCALPSADAAQLDHIIDRAQGNPFHVEELIRHVAAGWADAVPDTLLALAESRIGRLTPEERRYLRIASVFGETCWAGAVSALADGALTAQVESRLVQAELLVPVARGRFPGEHQFRHGLLRDAAYAMLPAEDRAALHLAAAGWLERAGENDALVLAEHLERAGALDKAASYLERASELAAQAWDLGAAMTLAERGVRCRPQGDLLGRLRLTQAICSSTCGDFARATEWAKAAWPLLTERSARWYCAAAIALASGAYVGDMELAPAIVQALLTSVPTEPPDVFYGIAVHFTSDILDSLGQWETTDALIEKASALVGIEAAPAAQEQVLFARAAALLRRDRDLSLAIVLCEQGLALAEQSTWSNFHTFRFGAALVACEYGDFVRGRQLLRETRDSMGRAALHAAWCSIHEGWCDFVEGHFEEARIHARRAFELDPRHAYALAALASLELGEIGEARRLSAMGLEGIDDALVTPFVVAVAFAVATRIAVRTGELEVAASTLERVTAYRWGPPSVRSFLDRTEVSALVALGRDHGPVLARALERIDRHAASLEPERRASYVRLPDHRAMRELVQR